MSRPFKVHDEQAEAVGLINCLNCRRCQLLPATDMSDPMPVVFCTKKQDATVLILSGCGLADPRYYYVKENGTSKTLGGDRAHRPTPVMVAWLKANYHRTPFVRLKQVTGRSREALGKLARSEGWPLHGRLPSERRAQGHNVSLRRQRAGTSLNAAQRAYVMERYNRNDWPMRGGSNNAEHLARRYKLQNEILEDVAKLGPRWDWRLITKFISRQSPAVLRKKELA